MALLIKILFYLILRRDVMMLYNLYGTDHIQFNGIFFVYRILPRILH